MLRQPMLIIAFEKTLRQLPFLIETLKMPDETGLGHGLAEQIALERVVAFLLQPLGLRLGLHPTI